MNKRNIKITGIVAIAAIVFAVFWYYPQKDVYRNAEANYGGIGEETSLQGRKIGLFKGSYLINEDTVVFCDKTAVSTDQITNRVFSELEKKLEKEGAIVSLSYSNLNQLVYADHEIQPVDFVLGITHVSDLTSFFDESMDSDLSRYIKEGSSSESKEVQLAYALQKELLEQLGKSADIALTLNMGLLDEGRRENEYRPVAITVRPYSANSLNAACDYLNRQELVKKEVDAIFQGIVNYYK